VYKGVDARHKLPLGLANGPDPVSRA